MSAPSATDDSTPRPSRRPWAPLPAALTEAQWQTRVLDLAGWRGWLVYHPYDSRRSTPGFPDLVLVRDSTLLFVELKTARGRVTREQRRWLADLSSVPGVGVYVWRPEDWPDVQEVLR